jgi:hypothetical protein
MKGDPELKEIKAYLCACGCDELIIRSETQIKGNRFPMYIGRHAVRKNRKYIVCACGCGEKFYRSQYDTGNTYKPEHRELPYDTPTQHARFFKFLLKIEIKLGDLNYYEKMELLTLFKPYDKCGQLYLQHGRKLV